MRKILNLASITLPLLSLFSFVSSAMALNIGDKAPNFSLQGSDGKTYELEKFKGKTVVLEWYNDGCPYVRKHYDPNNMQRLQAKYKDVVWLTVNSSAQGKQGHLATVDVAAKKYKEENMKSKTILLDGKNGKVGRLYGAKTTPHMYIINKKGHLEYKGAIDSIKSTNPDDIKLAKNYVDLALRDLANNKKVKIAKTKQYGCSVKY